MVFPRTTNSLRSAGSPGLPRAFTRTVPASVPSLFQIPSAVPSLAPKKSLPLKLVSQDIDQEVCREGSKSFTMTGDSANPADMDSSNANTRVDNDGRPG